MGLSEEAQWSVHLGLFWYGYYSQAALWEACWGVPFRGDAGSYWFSLVHSEKLAFYALGGIMGEIGLLLDGWDRWNGWSGGRTGVGWRERCYWDP